MWNGSAFGIAFGLLFVLLFTVSIGSLVFMVLSIVDIAKRPEWQWRISGQEKVLWLVLVILVQVVSLFYWFFIRKKLMAVEQSAAAGLYGPGFMTFGGWQPGTPPGWYPDNTGQSNYRYWDGIRWTEHVHTP